MKKEVLRKFYYRKRLSMPDMAKTLDVTPAAVLYWMKKHSLCRRSKSESAYVKQNPDGDPFAIKQQLSSKEKELLLVGLMLYWAEGSRRNKHVIQLANLDARMIEVFIKFLRIICGLKENKLCLTIQLYRDFDKGKTRKYWSKRLGVPGEFIAVNIHSDARSRPTEQWSRYGIARIEVRNTKLKQWVDLTLERYLKTWI